MVTQARSPPISALFIVNSEGLGLNMQCQLYFAFYETLWFAFFLSKYTQMTFMNESTRLFICCLSNNNLSNISELLFLFQSDVR